MKSKFNKSNSAISSLNNLLNNQSVESSTFWIHKFYPGRDPVKYLELSWKKPEKKYFVLNNQSIYFGRNELTNAIIEGKHIIKVC